jgi:monoamine oxidase
MRFKGTERSGYRALPGAADQLGGHYEPVPLSKLLENEQLPLTLFEDNLYMQATMFQPVGGMDQFAMGFKRAIKSKIVMGAEVTNIHQTHNGVTIAMKDTASGAKSALKADYVICTIPLTILSKIANNFDKPVKAAIASVKYDHSNKVAFESPRFWEKEQIYGGISFVGGETNMVWYPSWGLHSDKAVLVACYSSGVPGEKFAKHSVAEQIAMSAAVVERLHPGKSKEMSQPIVVNWTKIPYNMGPWPNWEVAEGTNTKPAYMLLNQPHGRVHFCGAHLSQMPGWQEGAVYSAHRTIAALAKQNGLARVPTTKAG